ncbi:MAG: DUF4897 domain-containing protein [Halobacteriales archaeon]
MRGRVIAVVGVALCLLVAATSGAAVAQTESGTDVEVQVDESGDAVWTVTTTLELEGEDEQQAFDNMDNQAAAERAASRFQGFAERAENQTGREMSVELVSADTEREGNTGTVTVELEWAGFGTSDGDTGNVTVDDIFEGGLSLEEGMTVTVRAPDGYEVGNEDATGAEVNESYVRWTGPVEVEEDVSFVFESTGTDGEEGGEGLPGFTAVAALVATAMVAYRLR